MSILEQTSQVLDTRIGEIEGIFYEYMSNIEVSKFLYLEDPLIKKDIYPIIETRNSLYNYSLYNKFILGTYVFFKKSNLVLARDLTEYSNVFYEDYLSYEGMKYEDFYENLLYKGKGRECLPEQIIEYKGRKVSVVTFIQQIGKYTDSKGAIVLLVNNTEIKELLSGVDVCGGGIAYITDEEGKLISTVSTMDKEFNIEDVKIKGDKFVSRQEINGVDMLVTFTTSNFNGWRYVAVQPYNIVMEKVIIIKRITWLIFFATLAAGIILSYYLAKRSSKPIMSILQEIEKNIGVDIKDTNNYDFIKMGIRNLMDSSEIMSLAIKEQKIMLRNQIYNRILKGDINSEKEIETLLLNLNDDNLLKYDKYVVIIASVTLAEECQETINIEDMEKKRIAFREVIVSKILEEAFISDMEDGKILILTGFHEKEKSIKLRIQEIIKFLDNTAKETLELDVTYYVGGLYEELSNVFRSYQESKYLIDNFGHKSLEKIQWYNENNRTKLFYYYPLEIETRLINCTKAGEKEEVEKILKEIYEENMSNRNLSPTKTKTLAIELWGSLLKVTENLNLEEDSAISGEINKLNKSIYKCEGIQLMNQVSKIYYMICNEVMDSKKSNNQDLKHKLIKYINDNYKDPDLSLTKLGEEHGFSNVYLSHFFKEQTGESFSNYLERIRMEQAQKLLNETDLNINIISEKVGYYTSATFCRAYKRRNGISPNNSRKKS
ncbi:AraC family transcriptional regulator [Clostridium grantii]|nr:AraC family transcriptional regulator [Clostridium grantii]